MVSRFNPLVVAYVAAPHGGYLKFFRQYAGGTLCILGEGLISEFSSLTRHLPGVSPAEAAVMIGALKIFDTIYVVDHAQLQELSRGQNVVMPDEDVSHTVAEKYLPGIEVTFDASWKLRWDLNATTHSRPPEGEVQISYDELDILLMGAAADAAKRSPDWWRQVGGVLSRDGEVLLLGFNKHLPSDQIAYLYGDPRSNFGPGQCIDMSVAVHTEIVLMAEAARRGLSTDGCDLYVTTFPCPPCAGAHSLSGIRRLFYSEGYSLVEGANSLRSRGVELIRVQTKAPSPE